MRALIRPLPARPNLEEKHLLLADVLAFAPAVLAGIGGALLGDRIGLWIKKSRTSEND